MLTDTKLASNNFSSLKKEWAERLWLMLVAIRAPEFQGRGVGGGYCVGERKKKQGEREKAIATLRPLSSKLCMLLGWSFNRSAVKNSSCFTWKGRGCALWSGNSVTHSVGLPDYLPPPSLSLSRSVSLCGVPLLLWFTLAWLKGDVCLWVRIKMPKSDKINYCLSCYFVLRDFSLPQHKGRDKDKVTGSQK